MPRLCELDLLWGKAILKEMNQLAQALWGWSCTRAKWAYHTCCLGNGMVSFFVDLTILATSLVYCILLHGHAGGPAGRREQPFCSGEPVPHSPKIWPVNLIFKSKPTSLEPTLQPLFLTDLLHSSQYPPALHIPGPGPTLCLTACWNY